MKYTKETAAAIVERIANGESLRSIVKSEGMPAQSTVYVWLMEHPDFAEQYARAREDQADTYADEIAAIADDETIPTDSRRVRIDARKWIACKLKPRKYGDKVDHTLASPDGGPVKHSITVEFV